MKDREKKKRKKDNDNDYKAEKITLLEGLTPVRRRPAMYIGSTDAIGLHHLIYEVVDNSIDEAIAGFCNEIVVELLPGDEVRVADNGRGIPVDKHKQTGLSALEVVMTKLHAGAKFNTSTYKVSGGLHGVGVSVVNALSARAEARVKRDGKIYQQEYKQGKAQGKVKVVGKAEGTGTEIIFQPDPEIFSTLKIRWEKLLTHLRQQAYLTSGITIKVIDSRDKKQGKRYVFYFEGGTASFVRWLNRSNKLRHTDVFHVEKEEEGVLVEVALQYTEDYKSNILGFANNIHNIDGGTHLSGFKAALTRTLNYYAEEKNFLKKTDPHLSGDDVREGLTAVVSVKIRDPQFEGQTKTRLGNREAMSAVQTVVSDALKIFLEEHPLAGKAILQKSLIAAKAREAAKTARNKVLRKGALHGLSLPGKLADCSFRNPERSELFVVEGDSAGGCFSGNTKVALADGRDLSFKQLVKESKQGKENYCYTILENGTIGIKPIKHPRKTKINTEVLKIILDNKEEIVCTPDHLFMLRDGSYKQAQNLTPKDSLMPLRRTLSKINTRITIKGYEMVYDYQKRGWVFSHRLADKYNLDQKIYLEKDGDCVHHRDFNKLNNNPTNLRRMNKKEHLKLHAEVIERTLHTEEAKEKARRAHRKKEYREKMSKVMSTPEMRKMLSRRARKQWEDEEYKGYMTRKFLDFYHNNDEYRRQNNERLNEAQRKYWNEEKNRRRQSQRVKEYYENHPEKKKELSKLAKEQWQDKDLLSWRSDKTKEQWTEGFRRKRMKAYNNTYQRKALELMRRIYEQCGRMDKNLYRKERLRKNDKSILRHDTICQRFFGNDEEKLKEAVLNYNHKIVAIKKIKRKIDVYDLEVEDTHNFALASGIFVHNSAKMGRDRRYQAILPLRGKILNVERARLDKILNNNELKSLIVALGTNIGEEFDISKLRYHKIIIMNDADVDGRHLTTLLLTFFYRYFPDLIKKGYIYVAQPPLYRIERGKKTHYVYTEEEKKKMINKLSKSKSGSTDKKSVSAKEEQSTAGGFTVKKIGESLLEEEQEEQGEELKSSKVDIQRYKGLGEMNPRELFETTMDPERRILKQITIEDNVKADEVLDTLMGSEVAPRKSFIQNHARGVRNLDV